jgi:hypothetical protein
MLLIYYLITYLTFKIFFFDIDNVWSKFFYSKPYLVVIKKNHNWSLLIQTIVVHVYGLSLTFHINGRANLDKDLMKLNISIDQKL